MTAPYINPNTLAEPPLSVRVESVSGYTYVGEAAPGAAEGDSVWRIQRIDGSGNTLWVNGDPSFIHKWTDRLSLSYL